MKSQKDSIYSNCQSVYIIYQAVSLILTLRWLDGPSHQMRFGQEPTRSQVLSSQSSEYLPMISKRMPTCTHTRRSSITVLQPEAQFPQLAGVAESHHEPTEGQLGKMELIRPMICLQETFKKGRLYTNLNTFQSYFLVM